MATSPPNAKICPRCGLIVPTNVGVCGHCGRLFRTPISETLPENRTMMFHDESFLPPVPVSPPPRVLRLSRWLRRMRTGAVDLLNYFLK